MSLEELKKDSMELETLLSSATRQRVKDLLVKTKAEIDMQITNLEMKAKIAAGREAAGGGTTKRYLKELQEYAWDQSNKFVKLFVTLDGVQNLAEANVTCTFTENSMNLLVSDLNGKDYGLTVNNLLEPIDVENSYRKIKNGMVAIYMKKAIENKDWDVLTTIQKRLKQRADEQYAEDKDSDPQDALVNIIKKMYNSGDSSTKQLIAKAWTESQDKIGKGGQPFDM